MKKVPLLLIFILFLTACTQAPMAEMSSPHTPTDRIRSGAFPGEHAFDQGAEAQLEDGSKAAAS